MPKATTFQPLPACLSSTALTALEPMSRPITALDFPRPNTWRCPLNLNPAIGQSGYQTRLQRDRRKVARSAKTEIMRPRAAPPTITVSSATYKACGSGISVIPRSPYRRGAGPTAHVIGRAAGRLDTPQKHPYDLGLPLPGPARP